VALERAAFGLRLLALVGFTPGRAGVLIPALLAFDSPIAMACFADRTPCLPSRTCSISSRTYSPALLDADFALRTRACVFLSGIL
jgi:hypothetical protein